MRLGYWMMRLFRDRAKHSCWLDNPNHVPTSLVEKMEDNG